MGIKCGVPGIAIVAAWAAHAPKNLTRSTKPLMRRKVTWKLGKPPHCKSYGVKERILPSRVFSFYVGWNRQTRQN